MTAVGRRAPGFGDAVPASQLILGLDDSVLDRDRVDRAVAFDDHLAAGQINIDNADFGNTADLLAHRRRAMSACHPGNRHSYCAYLAPRFAPERSEPAQFSTLNN
jgi:hypothetical protein